jgi:hypothetical protein
MEPPPAKDPARDLGPKNWALVTGNAPTTNDKTASTKHTRDGIANGQGGYGLRTLRSARITVRR